MMTNQLVIPAFREGDKVVLALGSYQGTPGVFVQLTPDVKWAEIRELNGEVRNHPVEWLAHSPASATGSTS